MTENARQKSYPPGRVGNRLSFLSEIVQAQCAGLTTVLLVFDRGYKQNNGSDDKGKRLIDLCRHFNQPSQNSWEGTGQAAAGDTEGIEEAKDEGAQNGKGRIPVGKDNKSNGNPTIAIDPAAGVEGAGHIQAHVVAANAHNSAAETDMQIFEAFDIDADRVS